MAHLIRLDLTHFRNHAALSLALPPQPGAVALIGANGAGKTGILEAISLLAPGRGLRGAGIDLLATRQADGSTAPAFTVSAELAEPGGSSRIATGTRPDAPSRRIARINGAGAAIQALADRLAIIWLTPAMDRLFTDPPAARRRYVDRLALALDPGHGRVVARYEASLAERNRLLAATEPPDASWLSAVEARLAEYGAALAAGRRGLVAALAGNFADSADDFPTPLLALDNDRPDADIAADFAHARPRDRAAGRTTGGPHRVDLVVRDRASGTPAALASTGEQKALLIGLTLAMARLVAERRGAPPLLLLDEVAAHLDPARRALLFARIADTGAQAWMTGTEPMLFGALGPAACRIIVSSGGRAAPA